MSELFYIEKIVVFRMYTNDLSNESKNINKTTSHCVQESTEKCMVILLLIIFVFPGMY